MRKLSAVLLACLVITPALFGQGGKAYGIFAPEDAYIDSSGFPYYGSENEWSRRMFTEERGNTQYKRRGQRQMLAVIEGRPDSAIAYCKKRLKQNPEDPESYYMMSVAFSAMSNKDSSYIYMLKAIEGGIPYSRFLAGPRTYLKSLYDSEEFVNYHVANPVELVHGPMVGAVTDHSAEFWLRTFNEDDVLIKVFEKEDPAIHFSGTNSTDKGKDYTTVIEIDGLNPNTTYNYDVVIEGRSEFGDTYPSFSTYPAKGTPGVYNIAFGGGAGFTPDHEYIWSNINTHDLDALLLLGDNVYIDMPGMPNEFHNFTYYRRQSSPGFRSLINSTPVYAIWDDHDAAMDDVWMGPYVDKPEWKYPNFLVFKNNWVDPYYGTENWPGCYFDFSIGDIDFFMLDCRSYRTCPFDTTYRTMLGPYQKQWLKNKLALSEATVKVLVSSVPWSFRAKPGSHDTWGGFPEEREEIFEYIEELKIDGVILMAADRHRSDAWRIERANGYDLYEFQSSRLTNMHTHELMPGSIIAYNEKCSFGHLSFDTISEKPKITFTIINIDNVEIDSVTVYLEDITYANR